MVFRTAVYEARPACPVLDTGYSGVRGAPHRLQAVRPSTRLCAGLLGYVQRILIKRIVMKRVPIFF